MRFQRDRLMNGPSPFMDSPLGEVMTQNYLSDVGRNSFNEPRQYAPLSGKKQREQQKFDSDEQRKNAAFQADQQRKNEMHRRSMSGE